MTAEVTRRAGDRTTVALGMISCALFLGWAVDVLGGAYSPLALALLTVGAIFCVAPFVFRTSRGVDAYLDERFTTILGRTAFVSTLISAGIVVYLIRNDPKIGIPLFFLAGLGLLQTANLRRIRIPIFIAMVTAFCTVSVMTFISPRCDEYPNIDVFLFQQSAADALMHGRNPYALRFPNIYSGKTSRMFQDPVRFSPGTPFYGLGVVDENGWLTYGFPYPPLSLLMAMPAYLLGGDCRFAYVVAMGLSAILMAAARPGRWATLAAVLFLINPQGFYVIDMSWTEPMLVFTFSIAMFCACRWRKGLPWALGLFFATKQYSVLALPVLFLLVEGPNPFKQLLGMVTKAGLVVAGVTLPFFAWNPHEFIRSVVQWQLIQPFRTDALSYLVWIYNHNGDHKPPIWTPLLMAIPAIIIAVKRCARTPAGFAAAVTLICLAFFAFNKQAFCNYYYFVISAALWSVAGMQPKEDARSVPDSGPVTAKAFGIA